MQDLYIPLQDTAKRLNIKVSPIQSTRSSLAQLMPEFQVKSNAVQLKLQLIRNNNEEIAKNTETIHKAAETLKEKESMKKVEKIQQSTTLQTTEIKKLFAEIETLIKNNDPNEPETRAMEYTKKALSQEVAILLQQSQDVVHQYNSTLQNKMKRQLDLLQPNLTDQQRNEIIQDPSGLEKIVCEQTLGKASLQVQYRVQDIQEKYKDIQKLEKSTQYCFQMLSEIALLVNQQGEQIDSIEQNLNKAQNYIQKAEKKMAKEKEVHQKSRKKMCCIIIIGLIALGIIATPIILKFVKK